MLELELTICLDPTLTKSWLIEASALPKKEFWNCVLVPTKNLRY